MAAIESDQCLSHGMPDSDDLEISVFGPGFGECLALHMPGGQWILVDSCRDSLGEPATLAYLRTMGVDVDSDVTMVVASHWHFDHVDGIADIVRECRSAEPVMSAALYARDLFAYAGAVQYLGPTAPRTIRELRKLTEIIEEANPARVITLTQARMKLLESDYDGIVTTVEALSPSPASVRAAIGLLSRTRLVAGQELETPRPDYNSAALVLRIVSAGIGVLLASDLEIHSEPARGWSGIAGIYADDGRPCELIKIAHHGSVNGDAEVIWSGLLTKDPLGLVTHFHNGSVHLPDAKRLELIASRCVGLFSTSGPAWSPGPAEADVVADLLDRGKPLSTLPLGLGHVRARIKPGRGSAWRVSVCGPATVIAPPAYPSHAEAAGFGSVELPQTR